MTRILGIDPGSRITGYGVIDMQSNRATHLAHGALRLPQGELPARLKAIFDGITEIIREFQPAEMAVERVFMNRNADSALKLGQARGAALVAGVNQELPIFEFTPAQIKQAIVGKGNADKTQIQHMIRLLLNLQETPSADAADALAVALCHGHTREGLARMRRVQGLRSGRLL